MVDAEAGRGYSPAATAAGCQLPRGVRPHGREALLLKIDHGLEEDADGVKCRRVEEE